MVNGPPSHQLYDLRVAFYDPSAPHSIKFADHRPENGRRENPDESANISTGNHPQRRRLLRYPQRAIHHPLPVFTVLCFLELTNPSSRSLTRTMLCFHALTNPSASNSFVFTSIQNAGCHPPTLGLPSVLSPSIVLSLFAATHPRNAPVTPFPATHPKIRGVGHIVVNLQQRGCPDLTNRSDQHSVRHHGRWVHRFDFHATFAPMV